jgi:nucleotide-binding universal stress UspA family protein
MTLTSHTNAAPTTAGAGDSGSLAELIVGVDGTYAAGEALGWAARIARTSGAGLTAVHTWPAPALGDRTVGPRTTMRRRRALRSWCQPARDAGVEAQTVVGDGDLRDVLASIVRSRTAPDRCLVVLGRAAPGSGVEHDDDHQCDRIARRLPAPLAVVPSPGAGRPLRRVVIGVAGSAGAEAAATWVASVAGTLDLDVHAVTVFEPMVEWVPRWSQSSVWTKVRHELEGPWTEPLRRRGVACATRVVEGINVDAALTQFARRCHADGIVVGLGDGGHRRRHPATKLLERCHLPVILVPVGSVGHADGAR